MKKLNIKDLEKEIGRKIDYSKSFSQNNFDSLDLISLVHYVEEKFKVKITDKKLSKIKSFKDIEKIIN